MTPHQLIRRSACQPSPVVLLVQPERDDRDMYEEYLSRKGLRPICVQEALIAQRLAGGVDVIVTDLLLPGPFDGCALIEWLKRDACTRRKPVLVLTVCAWAQDEARAHSAGCDRFLSKPCLPHVLLREIRRLLRRVVDAGIKRGVARSPR